MLTMITFGQDHVHVINGTTFDKNCVAVIEHQEFSEGRAWAFKIFGSEFSMEYPEKYFNKLTVKKYYPRGLIPVFNTTKREINGY